MLFAGIWDEFRASFISFSLRPQPDLKSWKGRLDFRSDDSTACEKLGLSLSSFICWSTGKSGTIVWRFKTFFAPRWCSLHSLEMLYMIWTPWLTTVGPQIDAVRMPLSSVSTSFQVVFRASYYPGPALHNSNDNWCFQQGTATGNWSNKWVKRRDL